ncbi:MAG: hypothetical protein KDB03_22220 [Planctomycetales bacterium]|nr:hypothetical protein [Planctomycetales bacterium]
MKRVHEFLVETLAAKGVSRHPYSSWHRVWEHASDAFFSKQATTLVYDPLQTDTVIAIFSASNLQHHPAQASCLIESASNSAPFLDNLRWVSQRVPKHEPHMQTSDDIHFYINMNISEFYWGQVEGAKHELPFRLSFLERRAEQNPDSLWARGLGLFEQWRDMLSGW